MSETISTARGIARHGLDSACWCYGDASDGCACGPEEKALRIIAGGKAGAMSAGDREWCLDEIAKVEGYSRADHLDEPDHLLANSVLSAWTDFCRDKGLL